jgi:hypothetical protein
MWHICRTTLSTAGADVYLGSSTGVLADDVVGCARGWCFGASALGPGPTCLALPTVLPMRWDEGRFEVLHIELSKVPRTWQPAVARVDDDGGDDADEDGFIVSL